MLTIQVWGYIDQYWIKLPTFPDPVTKIHYTTTKLVNVIYRQMNDDSHQLVYHGEPAWVYTICQNHPHLALKFYDIVRSGITNFSLIFSKWTEFLIKYAFEDMPLNEK